MLEAWCIRIRYQKWHLYKMTYNLQIYLFKNKNTYYILCTHYLVEYFIQLITSASTVKYINLTKNENV